MSINNISSFRTLLIFLRGLSMAGGCTQGWCQRVLPMAGASAHARGLWICHPTAWFCQNSWKIRVGENLGWNSETCTVNCRAFKFTNLHLKIASLEDEWVFFWAPVFQVWCVVSFRECMTWSHPAEKDKWWIGRIECSQKTRHFSLANSHIVQLSSLPVWNRQFAPQSGLEDSFSWLIAFHGEA